MEINRNFQCALCVCQAENIQAEHKTYVITQPLHQTVNEKY